MKTFGRMRQALDLVHLIGHAGTSAAIQQHHGAGPVDGQPHDLDQVAPRVIAGRCPPSWGQVTSTSGKPSTWCT